MITERHAKEAAEILPRRPGKAILFADAQFRDQGAVTRDVLAL